MLRVKCKVTNYILYRFPRQLQETKEFNKSKQKTQKM